MTELRTLKVALLGCGNVGAQVARILIDDADAAGRPAPAPAWSWPASPCATSTPPAKSSCRAELFTTDAETLVKDADLVIELMGGIEPARTLILTAMRNGACVVTGNKALLAKDGPTLYEEADKAGVQLSYEAAVAGAIPILRPIRDSLSGDRITRVLGIVNGTTNFILDQMDSTGAQFADALAEAQRLGYAEADPTADVEGHDAAAKAAILASLSFHTRFALDDVLLRGHQLRHRRRHRRGEGRRFCHQAAGDRRKAAPMPTDGNTGVSVRVHPTLLPREHPLAAVRGAFNAVFIEAENAGELMFYGQGAGGNPDRLRRAGRPRLRRPPHRPGRPRPHRDHHRPRVRRCPSTPPSPATTSASTSPTSPACWQKSPSSSPSTASPLKSCGRPSTATPIPTWNRRNCGSSPTAQARLHWQPPSRPSRAWTSSIPLHPYCG